MSRVVIAGGGTAGHVQPALAVARVLAARGHEVSFVGSRRGLEARLVPEAGFAVDLLPGRGVVRRISWQALLAVLGIGLALARAVSVVRRRRPAVILAVGGYAAAPAAVAGLILRIPVVLAEQNAVPGLTNRVASRWAVAAAVSFPGSGLPAETVTGNPVRDDVLQVDRSAAARQSARAALGLPADAFVIAVTGGSLGSLRINTAVVDLATRWKDRGEVSIYHVVGARDWPEFRDRRPSPTYTAVEYEERIPLLLSAADLWVGRAGGSTIAELTAVGVPSILVPLPIAPHDHQGVQARQLAALGGCIVVNDEEFDGARLEREIVAATAALDQMAAAAAGAGHRDAAYRVADLLEEYAND